MLATPDLLRRARGAWRRLQARHPGWHVGSVPRVEVEPEVAARARQAIDRMLAVKA